MLRHQFLCLINTPEFSATDCGFLKGNAEALRWEYKKGRVIADPAINNLYRLLSHHIFNCDVVGIVGVVTHE